MFKFFGLCCFALFALVAAKPSIIAPVVSYSTSLVGTPFAATYTSPYAAYATYAPYATAYSPYSAYSPYYSAYSTYPYGSVWLRK